MIGSRIDHHVPDLRQIGRECHIQIFPRDIRQEPLPFPEKIVMVGNGGNTRLRDHLGQRQAKRQIQRDRQRVFDHQKIDAELLDERIERLLQLVSGSVEFARSLRLPLAAPEAPMVDLDDIGMPKIG